MQIADAPPGIAGQLRQLRAYHRRVLARRAVEHWWPCVALILVCGVSAGAVGQFAYANPLYVFGPILALPVFFLMAWRVELGLLIVAAASSAFLPQAFQVKSLQVYPAIPLLLWLFLVLLVRAAFRVERPVLPSFRVIWPLLGLFCMAVISDVMVQVTWTVGVPHRINNTPIVFDELYGIFMFALPLIAVAATTAALSGRGRWIEYILRADMVLAVALAAIVLYDFRRIGATIYTFRFSEPKVFWMSLRAISQLCALGAMIAYARLLHSARWRTRICYGAVLIACLSAVYFCLQNSWWVEVGIGLLVMTIVYSRKLFLLFCAAAVPLLPLVKAEIAKLAAVKSADFYRLLIWQDGLRVWSKQLVLGVGPGNYWAYDQRFTQLPKFLRDFNRTGLGVAHNGYLQTLGEMGLIGLCLYVAFIVVMAVAAARLFRRSNAPEKVDDRVLGLIALGLIVGSAFGDFFSGSFFLQPRQVGSGNGLPQVLTSWFIWGCVMYKDQLWRMARRVGGRKAIAPIERQGE